MRFESNLSLLFTELPLLERPRAAAEAGFDGAESWWPFAEPDPGSEAIDALAVASEEARLTLACLNFFGGDFPAGERGVLSLPPYRDAWRANIACAVRLAERLQCRTLNALCGNQDDPLEILIEHYADRIGHVQIADAPGRIEPGTGTLDLIEPLRLLTRLGHDGWVGLEYTPGSDAHASLRRTMERLGACQETPQRA